ncbi:MAG TPA: hypothetical protein VNU94_08610 [Acidobacteriaceae bacterium]|nr:hypothetical protein [Acidobacteriaceae bacterium]
MAEFSDIIGEELSAVEFVQDFLVLQFEGPSVTFYVWPYVLMEDASIAYGEPGYRDALCAQIGDSVVQAQLEEGLSITMEFENGIVFGASLREEDVQGPQAGSFTINGELVEF